MWEGEFVLMYKIHCHFSTTSGKTTKKDNQNHVCILLYTERHSVWYVVYYCKHILTDICYRVERKGQLCPQMATLSRTFITLHVVQKVYATGLKKPLSGWSKMGNNKSIPRLCLIKPSTTSLHQVKNYADTREVNIKYLKTWQTIASVSGFYNQTKKKNPTILLFQFEYYHFSTNQKSNLK